MDGRCRPLLSSLSPTLGGTREKAPGPSPPASNPSARGRDPRSNPKGAGCRPPDTARPVKSAWSGHANESGERRKARGTGGRGGGGLPVWVASLVSLAAAPPPRGGGRLLKEQEKLGFLLCVRTFLPEQAARVPPPIALALGFSPCAATVRLRLTVLF